MKQKEYKLKIRANGQKYNICQLPQSFSTRSQLKTLQTKDIEIQKNENVNAKHVAIFKQDNDYVMVPITDLIVFKEKYQTFENDEKILKLKEQEILNAMKGERKQFVLISQEINDEDLNIKKKVHQEDSRSGSISEDDDEDIFKQKFEEKIGNFIQKKLPQQNQSEDILSSDDQNKKQNSKDDFLSESIDSQSNLDEYEKDLQ